MPDGASLAQGQGVALPSPLQKATGAIAAGAKSRRITPEEILESAPERVVVCPCGFDLARTRVEFAALEKTRWWPLLPAVMEAKPGAIALVGPALFYPLSFTVWQAVDLWMRRPTGAELRGEGDARL